MQPYSNTPTASHYLASLQAGRAVAALLVVLFHSSLYIFALPKYWGYDPAQHLFDFGDAGVQFFFVLSGFIILHIHWPDIGQPARLVPYLKKRFIRIYPIYWLVLAAVIPVYFLVPSFGNTYHREMWLILSSISLVYLDEQGRTALAVGWTLYHEVLFYAMFAVTIIHRRIGLALMTVWMLASIVAIVSAPTPSPLGYIASPLHLLFAMGMAACWMFRRGNVKEPRGVALLGVLIFTVAAMDANYAHSITKDIRNLIFGVGSALVLVGMAVLERNGRLRIPALLQLIGNASYCIYLTHFTLLSLFAKIFLKLGLHQAIPAALSYIIMIVVVVACGVVMHLLIEQPLLRFLNRRREADRAVSSLRHPVQP